MLPLYEVPVLFLMTKLSIWSVRGCEREDGSRRWRERLGEADLGRQDNAASDPYTVRTRVRVGVQLPASQLFTAVTGAVSVSLVCVRFCGGKLPHSSDRMGQPRTGCVRPPSTFRIHPDFLV